MSSVITPSDRQQEDIEVENVGKVEGDRDGTAFTGVIRHLAVNRFGSLVRRSIRVVLYFFFLVSWSVFISTCISSQSCSRWGQPESKTIVSLFFYIHQPSRGTTHNPRLTAMSKIHLHLVLGTKFLELFLNVLDDKVGDAGDSEVGYKTDREFA